MAVHARLSNIAADPITEPSRSRDDIPAVFPVICATYPSFHPRSISWPRPPPTVKSLRRRRWWSVSQDDALPFQPSSHSTTFSSSGARQPWIVRPVHFPPLPLTFSYDFGACELQLNTSDPRWNSRGRSFGRQYGVSRLLERSCWRLVKKKKKKRSWRERRDGKRQRKFIHFPRIPRSLLLVNRDEKFKRSQWIASGGVSRSRMYTRTRESFSRLTFYQPGGPRLDADGWLHTTTTDQIGQLAFVLSGGDSIRRGWNHVVSMEFVNSRIERSPFQRWTFARGRVRISLLAFVAMLDTLQLTTRHLLVGSTSSLSQVRDHRLITSPTALFDFSVPGRIVNDVEGR